jgi:hypothetical protein
LTTAPSTATIITCRQEEAEVEEEEEEEEEV